MCVTMWREKAPGKGDARCRSSVSCFLRKLTRVFLRTCLRLLTLPLFPPFFLLSQVDLHYFPAHCLKINVADRFSGCKCRRGGEKERKNPDRPGRCAPAERSLNTGPDSQDWTVWGWGSERNEKYRRMTSNQYKCSIHCCFCIQPLDSVKCFNICAILNYFIKENSTLAKSVQLYRDKSI